LRMSVMATSVRSVGAGKSALDNAQTIIRVFFHVDYRFIMLNGTPVHGPAWRKL